MVGIKCPGHHLDGVGNNYRDGVASAKMYNTARVRFVDGRDVEGIDDVPLTFDVSQIDKPHTALYRPALGKCNENRENYSGKHPKEPAHDVLWRMPLLALPSEKQWPP